MLVERLAYFVLAGLLVAFQERRGCHRNAAHAIPALRGLLGDQRALYRVQVTVAAEAFDGGDLLALGERHRHVARSHRPPVDEHEAGAALAAAAAETAADEAELVAQDVEQRGVRFRADRPDAAIHSEVHFKRRRPI